MSYNLPKWPQMYTTGKPVTVEQAKEIIRRTDLFFLMCGSGNDRKFEKKVMKQLRMPNPEWRYKNTDDINNFFRERDVFHERWRVIQTNYVHNDWIASSFIGGPHGWVHPDGTIGYMDNVGKWPSTEELIEDWRLIVKEFPFLDLGITLMDGESCEEEIKPVCSIRIVNGDISLMNHTEKVHEGHTPATRRDGRTDDAEQEVIRLMTLEDGEHGVPWEWIEDWTKASH